MNEKIAKRFRIRGRVQGVWFRASTRVEALRLGISGHALNLPDGGVEVLAFGVPAAVAELEHWLSSGPPLARVDTLLAELADPNDLSDPASFLCG